MGRSGPKFAEHAGRPRGERDIPLVSQPLGSWFELLDRTKLGLHLVESVADMRQGNEVVRI